MLNIAREIDVSPILQSEEPNIHWTLALHIDPRTGRLQGVVIGHLVAVRSVQRSQIQKVTSADRLRELTREESADQDAPWPTGTRRA